MMNRADALSRAAADRPDAIRPDAVRPDAARPDAVRPDAVRPAESAPVVILTFSYSGSELLGDYLASSGSLSCTALTGLLPMCESVAATWQAVEQREQLSALARSSIRAVVSSLAIARGISAGARLADAGPPRWCETAISSTSSASVFLKAFPQARFMCFYRSCADVIADALESNPWGLGNTEFWAYSGADPGNNVAAVGAYWAERTRALLDFQLAQPRSCLSVRREDLEADAPEQLRRVWSFLGLSPPAAAIRPPGDPVAGAGGTRPRFPVGRLSSRLRTVINELHARLGYPAL
jgi:protein-tyrosine sulfotransferase